jgi:hypothetical protein
VKQSLLLSFTVFGAALALRQTPSQMRGRETCVYTCGSVCYWQEDIDAAVKEGYSDFKSGDSPDDYPHQYNNYEGFDFPDAGPWYEFPILSSYEVYTGGSPGADRVIFTEDGEFESVITHTGASGNDFVACDS